jgi:hypothetical protein
MNPRVIHERNPVKSNDSANFSLDGRPSLESPPGSVPKPYFRNLSTTSFTPPGTLSRAVGGALKA